jgi:hypothetical protein
LSLPTEIRDQIISLEDRLERVELRRSTLPAGVLLFAVMAGFMFSTEIRSSLGVRSCAVWVVSFAVGTIALLAFNEVTARRRIRNLKEELKALRIERDLVLRKGAGQ